MAIIEIKGDQMPQRLTNCVENSVAKVFQTILGKMPKYHENGDEKKVGDAVVGIISFVGDITWLLMLVMPRASANSVVTRFCGFDVDYESPDMGDVVGELANVVAGDIIARLSEEGIKVGMSLPTIMRGHDVEPLLPRGLPSKKMHFTFPEGEFFLKLAGAKAGENMGGLPGV